jgi:hypothetical protein
MNVPETGASYARKSAGTTARSASDNLEARLEMRERKSIKDSARDWSKLFAKILRKSFEKRVRHKAA